MLNKNVVIMMFALALAAPAAFGQTPGDAEAAHEHSVEEMNNTKAVDGILKGQGDADSTGAKLHQVEQRRTKVEDATTQVQTGRQDTMNAEDVEANRELFSKAGNKPATPVADATRADQQTQVDNDAKVISMDPNAKAAGIDAKMARNISVLAKWNSHNAIELETSLKLMLKLHGDQIAQLDSATQAEVRRLIQDELTKAYAMGYTDDPTIDPNGSLETYLLNVNGNLVEMTRDQQKSFFLTLAKLNRAERDDTLRALHNKDQILEETAKRITAERKANGGHLNGGEEAKIERQVIVDLINAHHNLNPDDPNDPTKMTKQQISDLADEIMAKQC